MILPLTYFGSIGYFREFSRYQQVQIEVKENFLKQTYRNRCEILSANGLMSLTIPVKKQDGSKTALDRILIAEDGWRDIHWRSIRSAYESAPFFEHYGPEIKELIYFGEGSLAALNLKILAHLLQWLDLDVKVSLTTEFVPYSQDDPRLILGDKRSFSKYGKAPYHQVFPGVETYGESISMLDAIFCEGPLARNLLIPGVNPRL